MFEYQKVNILANVFRKSQIFLNEPDEHTKNLQIKWYDFLVLIIYQLIVNVVGKMKIVSGYSRKTNKFRRIIISVTFINCV